MSNIDNQKMKLTSAFLILCVLAFTLIYTLFFSSYQRWSEQTSLIKKTQDVELENTKQYASVAREVVQNFEMNRASIKIYTDPNYKTRLYVGPVLQEIEIMISETQGEPLWTIAHEVNISGMRVIEFNSKKMRVVACLTLQNYQVDHNGKIANELSPRQFDGAYVFLFDNGSWKLANFIDVSDPKQALQDWDYMPQELKEITGDINALVYKNYEMNR